MDSNQKALGQYMTPHWAAEALIERYHRDLSASDCVMEPTCGRGAFLKAIPKSCDAFGVEIDPALAEVAAAVSGRKVVVGDIRTVALPMQPTRVVGNPPFMLDVFESILQRSFELLPRDGLATFLLPAYFLQTSSTVVRMAAHWSMAVELMPRNLFPGLSKPIVWVQFRKSEQRTMVGFLLFEETEDVAQMPAPVREALTTGRGSVWVEAVDRALAELGGEAGLDAIYGSLAPRRPTANPHWREQARKVLQSHFVRTGPARYARSMARAA